MHNFHIYSKRKPFYIPYRLVCVLVCCGCCFCIMWFYLCVKNWIFFFRIKYNNNKCAIEIKIKNSKTTRKIIQIPFNLLNFLIHTQQDLKKKNKIYEFWIFFTFVGYLSNLESATLFCEYSNQNMHIFGSDRTGKSEQQMRKQKKIGHFLLQNQVESFQASKKNLCSAKNQLNQVAKLANKQINLKQKWIECDFGGAVNIE